MKIHCISGSVFLAIVFAASAFLAPAPSRADEQTYKRDVSAYQTAGANLDARINAVGPLLGSPTGLATWVNDVINLSRTFDTASHNLWDIMYLDAARNNTSFCDTYNAQLRGSWGTSYGIGNLSDDYGHSVSTLYAARASLEANESKLIEKLATAAANKQKIDPLLNDQLTATRTALSKLDPLYQAMISRNNGLMSNVSATKAAMTKPGCGQPTPAPTKAAVVIAKSTPTPTAKPTASPSPRPQALPAGIDRWEGSWVDGPPTTVSCGADLNAGGADLRMNCVVTPQLSGLKITVEGTFTLLCKLTSPTALTSTCSITGKWHETNYDANLTGTASLQFNYGRNGMLMQWQLGRDQPTRMPPMGTNGPLVAVWGTYVVKNMGVNLHH